MTIRKSVHADAADPRAGMTLDELAAFVQEALRQDIPGSTVVRQRVTWRGTIRSLEATEDRDG